MFLCMNIVCVFMISRKDQRKVHIRRAILHPAAAVAAPLIQTEGYCQDVTSVTGSTPIFVDRAQFLVCE